MSHSNPTSQPVDQRSEEFEIPAEITVRLKRPLKKSASDDTLTELRFRSPTVKEMRRVLQIQKAGDEAAAGIEMLALLSLDGLLAPDIDRLTFIDFQIAVEALQPFLALSAPSADGGA